MKFTHSNLNKITELLRGPREGQPEKADLFKGKKVELGKD